MADVIDLDSFRTRGDQARSVADTLREVARGIDAGEINPTLCYVAMLEPASDGNGVDFMWSMSTMSAIERVGLLARHLHLANGRAE